MNRRIKILVGALALLVLVVAVGVGTVMAQEATPTPKSKIPFLGGRAGFAMRGFMMGGSWETFDAMAEALGLTPEQFFAELRTGKTLAEIAEAKGVDLDDVYAMLKDAQVEAQTAAIEKAVEEGKLTREQADWMLQGYELGMMGKGMSFGRGHGFRGFGGSRGCPQTDSTAPTTPSTSPSRLQRMYSAPAGKLAT